MIKCPCEKTCPERTAECKRTCPRWAEYEAAKFDDYAERQKKMQHVDDVISVERRRSRNRLRGNRK